MTSSTATTRMTQDKVILDDRPCHTCGYNLKGLETGGKCPECGADIRVSHALADDTLGQAPRAYLSMLALGFLLTGGGVIALFCGILSLILDFFLAFDNALNASGGPSSAGDYFRLLILPLGAAAYATGTFIVTKPRPTPDGAALRMEFGRPEWAKLRTTCRILSIALAVGLGAYTIARVSGVSAIGWFAFPLALFGIASAIPVTLYLSNLAHWASDSHIANHVQSAGFFVTAAGAIMSLLYTDLAIFVGCFTIPLAMIFGAALFWMGYQTMKMNSMVTWAIKNEKGRQERDARMAEKARRYAEEAASRSGAPAGPEGADPHLLDTIERQHRAMEEEAEREQQRKHAEEQQQRGHKVDETGADPYALEDD